MRKIIIGVIVLALLIVAVLGVLSFTQNKANRSNLRNFSSSLFSFSYPENLTVSDSGQTADGQVVIIDLGPVLDKTSINIQATHSSDTPVSQIEAIMQAYKLTKSQTKINGTIPAVVYDGIVTLPGSGIREKATIFESNGIVYKIQIVSSSKEPFAPALSVYQQIVTSFKPR